MQLISEMKKRLNINTSVKVTRGSYKNHEDTILKVKKDYVTLKNVIGLSSKKKPYFIKIPVSNIKVIK